MERIKSTPPRSAPEMKPKDSQGSSPPRDFAFLVHSQESLNHNLPPEVDNPPLARQRRRRTRSVYQNGESREYMLINCIALRTMQS